MKGLNWLTLILAAQRRKCVAEAAGSALLSDIDQIQRIVGAVASSVDVPVSIKTRIGLTLDDSAGTRAIAAQNAGAQLIVMHGRSRACRFKGKPNPIVCAKPDSISTCRCWLTAM